MEMPVYTWLRAFGCALEGRERESVNMLDDGRVRVVELYASKQQFAELEGHLQTLQEMTREDAASGASPTSAEG